jgi:predicted TIM-barrel fold metal-dependent hydrolase
MTRPGYAAPVFDDAPMREWLTDLRGQLPPIELFDAHTHIGQNDPDEFKCQAGELKAVLTDVGARAAVFPMHEPDGYPPANDMVIDEAKRSEGQLVPFCRLDPRADPLPEAERALERGARGIKLHPRAEQFPLDTPELQGVFALANERRLPVLVHAGRGIPALGRHALAICERFPNVRLILAHAGISDLAWIWRAAPDHPNLFFDTAWWSASDLLTLYTLLPPRHVLFASDAPYATPAFEAYMNLRFALQAGLDHEQIQSIFGGQMNRIVSGEEPADAGPAPGSASLDRDPLLDRVYTFLVSAVGQMITGQDGLESLGLAALACEVGDDAPQAATCSTVLAMLELREAQVAQGVYNDRPARFTPGLPMAVLAACVARTPDVGMPPVGKPHMDVGERAA